MGMEGSQFLGSSIDIIPPTVDTGYCVAQGWDVVIRFSGGVFD